MHPLEPRHLHNLLSFPTRRSSDLEWNRIWSAHNGFFVDYTTGVATDDQAVKDQAVEDLTTVYVPEFSAFLAGATGLPEEALAELITEHVLTTAAVVDAQGSGDAAAAADADRNAAMHMRMLGDPLAEAIVAAQPESFEYLAPREAART